MILFLDFDGVLHPDEAYLVKGRPVLRTEGALFIPTSVPNFSLEANEKRRNVLEHETPSKSI